MPKYCFLLRSYNSRTKNQICNSGITTFYPFIRLLVPVEYFIYFYKFTDNSRITILHARPRRRDVRPPSGVVACRACRLPEKDEEEGSILLPKPLCKIRTYKNLIRDSSTFGFMVDVLASYRWFDLCLDYNH